MERARYLLVISRDRQTAEKPKKPKFYLPLLVYPEVRYFFVLIPKEFKNEFLKAEKAEKAYFYFKSRFKKKMIVFLKKRLIFLKNRFFTEKSLVFFWKNA